MNVPLVTTHATTMLIAVIRMVTTLAHVGMDSMVMDLTAQVS